MKKALFIILLIFLIACKLEIEQTIENKTNQINLNISEINTIEKNKTEEKIISEPKETQISESNKEEKILESQNYHLIDSTQTNASISSSLPAKKWIKGKYHIIEVIDVTEGSDACIIKVDNSTDLIDVGETKTINGVKIYVAEARIFNSMIEDKDICELVIT